MTITYMTKLSFMMLILVALSGCGVEDEQPSDTTIPYKVVSDSHDEISNKDMLARCRYKLDQMGKAYERLRQLINKLSHNGTLTLEEANKQSNWRTYGRQLLIVTKRLDQLLEQGKYLDGLVDKLKFAIETDNEKQQGNILTEEEWNMFIQADKTIDEQQRQDAGLGVGEDFELEAFFDEQFGN